MKKLILILAVVAMMLPSCKKINEALDSLDGRLDKLEQETIPSIDEQIVAINVSLDNLNAMDKELKGYIDGLTATATNLQEQINATNTKIDEVKAELKNDITTTEDELRGEIETAKANVIAQLEAAKEELENELATINATIATLKAKDAELDGKIANLQTYVDTELGKTTDWVNATFATLEQYNALVSEIATIKEQIKAINQSIADLETRLTTKINEDIATAVSTLNADIQQKVKDITEAYTAAIKTAKEEITAAYTTAIQTAINALDASLKAWVGEALSNYYTIAEVEAKITALQTAITEGDAALQEELKSLKSQLETTAAEITAAYKKAIEEAINTNNGVIDTKIANEIALVNQRINNEVAAINAKIAEIESRLDNVEAKIAELLARIQSVSYVPKYSDGKADIDYDTKTVELDFQVSPKSAINDLTKVWRDALSAKTSYVMTRAVTYVNTPIVAYSADGENATITVKVSLNNLDEDFFNGIKEASIALQISDGNNFINSDYVIIYDRDIYEIRYTTSDDSIITPSLSDKTIISNTYHNGEGIIRCSVPIHSLPDETFKEQDKLISITLPHTISSIGNNMFSGCYNLGEVVLPDGVTSIGSGVFENCTNLTTILMPNSIREIGGGAFSNCSGLTSIVIPNNVASIDVGTFSNCTNLVNVNIGNGVTLIDTWAFEGCISLSSITIPENVEEIGIKAFDGCTNLRSIYCKPIIPPKISYNYQINTLTRYGCFPENSSMKIYVHSNSYNDYIQYAPPYTKGDTLKKENWGYYRSYIEPYDFE